MFDIFLGKGNKKGPQELPTKQITVDLKSLPKLSQKELCTLVTEQQKYIKEVVKGFEKLCEDNTRLTDKNEQLTEKNEIINAETLRMNNQHEQLSVKFNNLQAVLLQMTKSDKEPGGGIGQLGSPNSLNHNSKISQMVKQEVKHSQIYFHNKVEFGADIEKSLHQLFEFYHGRMALFDKIEAQNKKLKEKLEEIDDMPGKQSAKKADSSKELAQKSLELEKAQSELAETTSKLQHQLFVVKTLRQEAATHQQQLAGARLELAELKKMNYAGLEIINLQLVEANTAKQKQISTLLQQLSDADASKQKAFSLMQSQLNKATTEKEELSRQLQGQLKEVAMKSDMERAATGSEIVNLKCEKTKLQRELDQLKIQKQRAQKLAQELKAQKHTAQEQAANKLTSQDGTIATLTAEVIRYQKENAQLQKELGEFKELINNGKEQGQQQDSVYLLEINQLKSKLDQSKALQDEMERQRLSQQSQLKIQAQQLSRLNETIDGAILRHSQEREKRQESEALLSKMKEESTRRQLDEQSLRAQLTAKLSTVTEALQKTSRQLQTKNSQLASAKEQLDSISTSVMERYKPSEADQAVSQLVQQCFEQMDRAKNEELSTLQQALSQKKVEAEKAHELATELRKRLEDNSGEQEACRKAAQGFEKKQAELLNIIRQKNQQLEESSKDLSTLLEQKQQSELYSSETRGKTFKRLQELEKLHADQTREMQEREQRLRKADNEQNQDRIKIESLKKTIAKNEEKLKENKQSMQKIYEETLAKTERIMQLETKLKDYKSTIQRQKAELVEQQESHEKKCQELQAQIEAAQKNTETVQKKELNDFSEKQFELQNKISILTEQLSAAEVDKDQLKQNIDAMKEENRYNEDRVKTLSQKREQALKEIQRLEKRLEGTYKEPMKSPTLTTGSLSTQNSVSQPNGQDRARKITEKALRGFEILSKQLQALYKEFITTFIDNMTEQRIKRLQRGINELKKKSSEMTDVLEGYL